MHHLLSTLAELAVPLPNPPPQAPPEVRAKASTVIGLIKFGSLIAAVAALAAFGLLALAAEHGGSASRAADMKEQFGKIIVSLVIVMTSTSLVTFIVA